MAESIDSDIDNLSSILTMWNIVPQGMLEPAQRFDHPCCLTFLYIKMLLLFILATFPHDIGLFLDSAIAVARKELTWETDYQREAQCSMRFKSVFTFVFISCIVMQYSNVQLLFCHSLSSSFFCSL